MTQEHELRRVALELAVGTVGNPNIEQTAGKYLAFLKGGDTPTAAPKADNAAQAAVGKREKK